MVLPKYVSETQLLSDLTPERQARFLLQMRKKCYECWYFDEGDLECFSCDYYTDNLNQTWVMEDIIQALNSLPHVRNKKERKAYVKSRMKKK